MKIKITLNQKDLELKTSPEESVLSLLKRNGINSVRDGCSGEGACGVCAILLDGNLVNSCLLKTPQVDGCRITTVEGLSKNRELHKIQRAFIDAGVVQCGYCTPSQILAVKELLGRTSEPSQTEIKDALSGSICRCTGYKQVMEAVQQLSGGSQLPEENFREDLNVIGKDHPKTDALQLVRAEKAFTEDFVPQEALKISLLTSPHAHARIKKIDTSSAENLEGVEMVLTYKNTPDKLYNTAGQGYPEPSPYDRRMFPRVLRHVGDRVAAVAAQNREIAEKALNLIEVEYDELPAAFSIEQSLKTPPIHDNHSCLHQFPIGADLEKNLCASNSGQVGSVEKGLKEADTVIERKYETKRVQCTPLEPHCAYTRILNGRLIVSSPTQVPFHLRRLLAHVLEIPETNIRVIKEKIGGGFGSKQDMVVEEIPAWVSWKTSKPAYLRLSRQQEFLIRPRYKEKIKVRMGAKKDGTLTAVDMQMKAAGGAYAPHGLTVPMNSCSKSLPIFRCPNMKFSVEVYYTNLPASGAYQGYGAPQGSYALQTAARELSEKLSLNHIEFLKKNGVKKGDRLEILKHLGEGREGQVQTVSSSGIHIALDRGVELMKKAEKKNQQNNNILTGEGAAIIQQGSGLPGLDAGNATVKMLGDGNFMVQFGGTDLGTGLDTVVQKMAAEVLNTDPENIAVTAADTDVTPFDVGSYASSGTYFSGGAVYRAAVKMKKLIFEAGSKIMGIPASGLKIKRPGKVSGGGKEISYLDIARDTQSGTGSGQLLASASFTAEAAPIPYAAHFARVSINKNTGEINVDNYYAIHDCGTPVNPRLAKGQIYGGVLKTIGHSLYEELKFDQKGRPVNTGFLDYKVPMVSEIPDDFRAELIFVRDPCEPFGVKSIGEVVSNGAAPALAAAIYDAAGVWMRVWPFTPEKIYRAINNKKPK